MIFEEPEGATPLDPDEKQGLKFSHITTRGELNELEQANIEQGLAWVSRRRGGSIFDDAFIRTLHKRLFGDVWSWADGFDLFKPTTSAARVILPLCAPPIAGISTHFSISLAR